MPTDAVAVFRTPTLDSIRSSIAGLCRGSHLLETAWQIVAMRRFFGEPWALSAVILITVAAVSVLAGVFLRGASLQERYRAR